MRAARWLGWGLLWATAITGVLLSAATFLAALPVTRAWVASGIVGWVDDAIAGTVTLEGISVLPRGGVELRGLRVFDPGGRLVLRVDHARLFPDVRGIVGRELRIALEAEGVDADALVRTADGELAIAAAFASARVPAPKGVERKRERKAPAVERGPGWTLRVGKLTAVQLSVRAEGPEGRPLELKDVALDARGLWGPRAAWLEARLAGTMAAPAQAPLTLELRAGSRDAALWLERLAVGLGGDQLEAVGEGDLERRTGRLALTRIGLSQGEAGSFAPAARLGGELNGTLYAESNGETATAAFTVVPAAAEATGRAHVAIAARLPPSAFAWGVSADVDRLDPSRLSLLAPPGSVTLRGSGAARGLQRSELAGRINLRIARSHLRRGEVGPIAFTATAGGGDVEIAKLEATAPGGDVGGRLRWREGRAVEGALRVRFGDLGRFGRNLGELIGSPLPPVEGSGHAEVALSGSSQAPRIEATVEAPRLSISALQTEGARLRIDLEGPDATLAFAARVPDLGPDPVRADLRGRFGDGRRSFDLAELAVAWPGTRFALVRPARLELAGPSVDRLLLASGEQRIEATGGVRRDGAVDGRLRLAGLELSRLPRGLVPEEAALEGQLTLDARASGTRAAPRVDATVGLSGASAWEVGGLSVLGDLAWDGELDRIEADLGLVRARGGAVDLSFDLPVAPGRARAYEEIRVELRGRAVPLDELVWLAGSYALISGDVELTSVLTGSVGAPVLHATAQVRNGTWEDLEGLEADGALDAEGDRLRVRASGALAGAPAVTAEAELALALGRFLSAPREAIEAARRAPGTLALRLPGLSLKTLAGRLELPADLAGRLEGEANLGGGLGAPRGTAWLSLSDGSGWGARAVAGRLATALAPERSGATLDLQLAGRAAARLDARIDLPAERLRDPAARAAAPFRLDAALPRSELAAWGGDLLALGGQVEGRGTVQGTLGAPTGELALSATAAVVEGRPLGALALDAKYAAGRTTAAVNLKPPLGGTLHADLALERDLGILAEPGPILAAKAEGRLVAERLDLGFLPALAPGVVRAASGAASVELRAAGPLGELQPVGTIRVAKGRIAVAELGEWTGATIEADLGPDVVELRRFDVRKGKGRLELSGKLTGLAKRGEPAELEATFRAVDFGVERAGMELVRLDLEAEGRGKVSRRELTLGIVAPQGEVRLPKRIPRTLQEVSKRGDITVGRPKPVRARRLPRGAAAEAGPSSAAAPADEPFKTVVHFVAPRRLRVRADQPRIDVELKADALFAFAGNREEANGSIEVVRGQVEPIGGRVFVLERGKVTFTGGRVMAGTLDVASRYDNPTAIVRATLTGTLADPRLQLSSEPPLEEAQIALLVATGRTELKAGAGGVNTLAAGDAGLAAAGAVAMGVFKDLLSDKLPVDSVSLDSTAVSAGKYLTDRIYVGYVRRFDARPENGENPDEVKIEYQLAPGWQVETRYGSAQSGGASIVWTRNY